MTVTLTGENSFALQQALQRLVEVFVAEHGDLALERIDCEGITPDRVREAVTGAPFLAARKMTVLRGIGTNKQVQEQLEQLLKDVPETTDVIIVEPRPDKRLAYYKFLKAHTELREFPALDAAGLARWLMETAKKRGGSLNLVDARYLVERIGTDQQLLSNELEKLLLHDPHIARTTIDLLTDPAPQSTIFQLLEAAFAGDRKKALDLYAEQRAQKVEPVQIIAMLAWQLHVLAAVKTAGTRGVDAIAKEARLNPFVVRKSQGVARSLTLVQLRTRIADLLRIDLQTKSTSIDADEALQHYLLTLAR
jgi:DNA polymerase-3 subunit delta